MIFFVIFLGLGIDDVGCEEIVVKEGGKVKSIDVIFTLYGLNYQCKFSLLNNKLVPLQT